jgi:predicted O-methyltransferase YrrM
MKTLSLKEFYELNGIVNPNYFVDEVDNFFIKYNKSINRSSTIRNDEVCVLGALVFVSKPKLVIETGTNEGLSTLVMALNSNAEIHTWDVPHEDNNPDRMVDDNTWGKAFRGTPIQDKIIMHAQSTFEIKQEELPLADFWFIDSGHSMKYVENETTLALDNLKNGGVIVWHDAKPNLPWGSDVNQYLNANLPDAIFLDTNTGMAYLKI